MKTYAVHDLRDHFRTFARKNSGAGCESLLDSVLKETWWDTMKEALFWPRTYVLIREHDGTVWLARRRRKGTGKAFQLPIYWAASKVVGFEYRTERTSLEEVFPRFLGEPLIKNVTFIGETIGDEAVKLMSEVEDPRPVDQFSRTWKQFVDHCQLYDGLRNARDRRYYWVEYADNSVEVRVGVYGLDAMAYYHAKGHVLQRA